jgi:hypothetical protein
MPVSSDSATDTRYAPPGEPLQQSAQILHVTGEPVELCDDDRLDFAGVNQRQ